MPQNPLLTASGNPLNAIAFDKIRNEHFSPAFDQALKTARERMQAILSSKAEPDFENTIVALETCSEELDFVSLVYQNLLSAETNPTLQALAKEVMPKLAAFSNDLFLDADLFARVKTVYTHRVTLKNTHQINLEQERLLEKTYLAFVRNGALLPPEKKESLRKIDERLSVITQDYGDHVLASTNAYEMVLTRLEDLIGLPPSAIEAAEIIAKSRKKDNSWVITLDYPSYGPFIRFSERRELREKLWRAYGSRATSGEHDNRPLCIEIAKLRHDRAQLLGYETHAHFVLEERMASKPETVHEFLERIWKVARPAADRDLQELRDFASHYEKHPVEIQPWDVPFYTEKLKKAKYDLDEETLRPYFKLENVVAGVFEHARRLYGLNFKKRAELPVYHPDVEVFEVTHANTDGNDGNFVGLLYTDWFPRPSKRGGAWMTTFRDQGLYNGSVQRPHVSVVGNLTKPTTTQPSLLNFEEVRTIFHEFGHALHGLLSECHYRSIGGPNVYWDFVELPSQIMENWVREKDGLDLFAKHHQTHEKIPADLVDRIRLVSRFQAGMTSMRQLNFCNLDLAWHEGDPSGVKDIEKFENSATEKCRLFPAFPGMVSSTGFSHIFAGGYSAGYYSYKWAEVLDADAFELFLENGLFNQETAKLFRTHILSRGGSEHPMELYKRFRGREPDPNALLRREGLI